MRHLRWAAVLVALAISIAAASCDSGRGRGASSSGTGSVFGSVLDRSFDFAASQVIVLLSPAGEASDYQIFLCEAGCDPAGLDLAPDTRAVILTVRAALLPVAVPAQFAVGDSARALAAERRPLDAAAATGGGETRFANATSGTVVLTAAAAQPGGKVAGQFDLHFEGGGVAHGTFEATVAGAAAGAPDGGTPPDGGMPPGGGSLPDAAGP